jgi:FkbM family methyltransferase
MEPTRRTYRTPRGAPVDFYIRPDTNDEAMISALLAGDEYQIRDLYIDGWALDIGSHVGSIALALAVDNPNLSVIAVEPVPDNADLIRRSIAANNLSDRVYIEEAGAGAVGQSTTPCLYGFTSAADSVDPGYLHDTRFVGNVVRGDQSPVGTLIAARSVSLASLVAKYGVTDFRFAKIDCEGCEYAFLSSDAELVQEWIGEYHDGPFERIEALLSPTHDVTLLVDNGGVGMFRAVRS